MPLLLVLENGFAHDGKMLQGPSNSLSAALHECGVRNQCGDEATNCAKFHGLVCIVENTPVRSSTFLLKLLVLLMIPVA